MNRRRKGIKAVSPGQKLVLSWALLCSRSKKRKKTTIEPLRKGAKIGQRTMLSRVDCMKVNRAFGCFDPDDGWKNDKIRTLCGMLGFAYQ